MKQDYGVYRYTKKELLKYSLQSIMLCAAADYLFYQNWWAMAAAVPITFFFLKWKKRQLIRERKKILNYQFKDALNGLSVAVQAGHVPGIWSGFIRKIRILSGNSGI